MYENGLSLTVNVSKLFYVGYCLGIILGDLYFVIELTANFIGILVFSNHFFIS